MVDVKNNCNCKDLLQNSLEWDVFWPLVQPLVYGTTKNIIDKPFPIIIKEFENDPTFFSGK
jgi:hypothetical protein